MQFSSLKSQQAVNMTTIEPKSFSTYIILEENAFQSSA